MNKIQYGVPPQLPPKHLRPNGYYRELEQASYALGKLQIAHGKIANSEHLIKPLITREASLSSKMEGTITDSKDVFILDATGKAPKQDTIVVANYRSAMRLAIQHKADKKISNYKIRQLHNVLLQSTPHKGTLGKYRDVDAWIGENENTPIENALYVAAHPKQVKTYMDNLLEYFNDYNESPIVKAAVFHYYFEAIHPFEDGNGRIGRMLIPALLHYEGVLSAPVLYTSEYFEKRSMEYREKLRQVDKTGNLTPWLLFFLNAIKEQCEASIRLVDKIMGLNASLHAFYASSQSPNMTKIIDLIFETPVFTVRDVINKLNVTRITSKSLIDLLIADGIVREYTAIKGPKNAAIYIFPRLIDLVTD